MQKHHKIELALRPNKTDAALLEAQARYYHQGGGKQKQRERILRMTPEKREEWRLMRLEQARAWKARNQIRVKLSRFSANCKARVKKKNPGIEHIEPWELIGCNVVEMQAHIEGMFREGIGWHNRNEWELDHIRPLCEFDLTDIEQVKQCLHYSNVQILIIGPHWDKARQESRAFMDKLAREYWQELRGGEYPGFAKAWNDFTKFRALRKAL
jgi:hypothetical protein